MPTTSKTSTITKFDDITIDNIMTISPLETTSGTGWYLNSSYGGLTSDTNPSSNSSSISSYDSTANYDSTTVTVPDGGNVLKLTFTKSGTVTASVRTVTNSSTKATWVVDSEGKVIFVQAADASEANQTFTFDVEPNVEYYFFANGSKMTYKSLSFTSSDPSINLDSTELSIAAGSSATLTATLNNFTDENTTCTWSSDSDFITVTPSDEDSKVATVSVKSGIDVGSVANVTVTAGDLTATCKVTVAPTSTTYTWDFTDSNFFSSTITLGSDIISDQKETTVIMSNPGAKFSCNTNSVTKNDSTCQVVKTEDTVANAMKLVIPDGESAKLSIELTTGSTGKALYLRESNSNGDASADGTVSLTASDYTKNVLKEYTADLTCGKTYYLDTTAYKAYIGKVTLTVTNKATSPTDFGAQAYDSGYYTNSENEKVGVIRYLQEYGDADGVTEYGFFFVDANGTVQKISKETATQQLVNGFYGDLYGIPSTKFENDYLAKPYVTINGTTMYADTITGSVGTDAKEVTYSSTETETEPETEPGTETAE